MNSSGLRNGVPTIEPDAKLITNEVKRLVTHYRGLDNSRVLRDVDRANLTELRRAIGEIDDIDADNVSDGTSAAFERTP